MRLMEILESLGDRLGVLEKAAPATPQSLAKIQTRTVTLAELTTEIRSDDVQALADLPAELTVPFGQIFDAAGIKPDAGGWTIEKLGNLLSSPPLNGLDRQEAQKKIIELLAADKVEPESLVKDAVARDRALDAFEASARKKVQERFVARDRRISEIDSTIEQLHKEKDQLQRTIRADEGKWGEWRQKKRALERELARTVGYLIDEHVITTDED